MITQHTSGRKKIYESAPSKIWLGVFTEEKDLFFPADHEGICRADNQFADLNIGYVRGDIHKQIEAQRDELLEALTKLVEDLECRAEWKTGDKRGVVDCGNSVYMIARAAIKKAEGKA